MTKKLDDSYIVGGVLMDLLIAKIDSYGLDRHLLKYISLYLDNRKQCLRMYNINSAFNDVISGGSQGSVVGPILFNVFFNDFFYLSIMPQFITLLTITHFQASQKLLTNWKKF